MFSRAYVAGVHPGEFYDLTLKEILFVVDAYDKRRIDFFNLNTRVIAWHSVAPHADKGKMPSFDNFLKIGEDGGKSVQSISERAEYIRKIYKEKGFL